MATNKINWKEGKKILLQDSFIAPLIEKYGDCTIVPTKKKLYFTDLVDTICSQQLSGKAAKTIFERIKKLLQGEITPEEILGKSDTELRNCGLSWSKVKYVKDLATKTKDNELKINLLDKLPDEEVIKELVNVKGIGRWSAEMFLMFSLCRPDIFPLDDLGIKKGFEKIVGRKWQKEKASIFAEKHWKPFRTLASWYLWRSLENK